MKYFHILKFISTLTTYFQNLQAVIEKAIAQHCLLYMIENLKRAMYEGLVMVFCCHLAR